MTAKRNPKLARPAGGIATRQQKARVSNFEPRGSSSPFRAVIFDLDGVVVDSEPCYLEAANLVLASQGYRIDEELNRRLMGQGVEESWRLIVQHFRLDGDLRGYIERYDTLLQGLLRRKREPLPGVRELLGQLRERRVPVGLATSSWEAWVEALLEGTGLQNCFASIAHAGMVVRPKPAPDLFLKAAQLLNVPPEACIAIEDTPSGLQAAKAAGMYAIQLRAASTAFPPLAEADLVLNSLFEFDFSLVTAPSSKRRQD